MIKPSEALTELAFVEQAIASGRAWLQQLDQRQQILVRILDDATTPNLATSIPTTIEVAKPTPTRTVWLGYVYRGEVKQFASEIDLYLSLLRRLWADFPDKRTFMADVIGRFGRTRRYVATSRAALFVGKPDNWIRAHSREFCEGWYCDENLNHERKVTILRAAIQSAGLSYGQEARLIMRKTEVLWAPGTPSHGQPKPT